MTFLKSHIRRAKQILSGYKNDKDGSAAIEFVLIAPIMVFLYIGLYEISIAFTVNGAVNRSSEVAASFPTFEETLDEQIIGNIMTATAATLDYPNFNIENLAVKIYSVEQVGAAASTRRLVGRASYEGSAAQTLLNDQTAADFQANLASLQAGDGFIVASVAYKYTPLVSDVYIQEITLSDQKLLNPRSNQGAALPINVDNGAGVITERADLNCTQTSGVFSCTSLGSLP